MTATQPSTHAGLLDAARGLVPQIAPLTDDIERERRLPPSLVAALGEAGLFRMLVPAVVGGGEIGLPQMIRVVETLAAADASTAWCVMQGAGLGVMAAFASEELAREVFTAHPHAVVSNGQPPAGRAEIVAGGYRVSGRWAFSSGCTHAAWFAAASVVHEHGAPRTRPDGTRETGWFFVPAAEREIVDTWRVSGLCGTGSHDIALHEVFVPARRTVVSDFGPLYPGVLYHFPMNTIFAIGFASVALGAARGALDAFVALATGRTHTGTHTLMRDRAVVQIGLAQAEGTLRAARALLTTSVEQVWSEQRPGDGRLSIEQRGVVRLAATHAIHMAADAVKQVYTLGRAASIFDDNPLERRFRDAHAVTQHIQGDPNFYEAVGRALLGLEPRDPRF
ncbi:MAG: acyl-CoA dehydrogenase family protein [Chloroflexi bacterium]|nr:acyl-CoA dehydrogenase family protein [Chloroflexota bacterium]